MDKLGENRGCRISPQPLSRDTRPPIAHQPQGNPVLMPGKPELLDDSGFVHGDARPAV